MRKIMNHDEYQKDLKSKSVSALRFIVEDACEAIKAQPDGINAGYYADEIHYAHAELRRRQNVTS